MKTALKILGYFSLTLLSLTTIPVYADAAAGEKLATQCAACHGAKGISSNAQYPNLAAQQSAYIAAQLALFKSGKRDNPLMKGIAANLSEENMANLGDFFASLPNTFVSKTAKASSEGQAKYAMCAGCHGETGEGRGGFPSLRHQQPDYLIKQLQAFAKGTRKGGPMPALAAGLSEEDIKNVTDYLSSLK